ncbi:MAG: hypothetical protein CM15mP32_5870 [Flavobacteriaceae bacterium]|nr:MAG: hypothetical protein CM15mP32_5870 [Flavobacteriaceae bacterium]
MPMMKPEWNESISERIGNEKMQKMSFSKAAVSLSQPLR